VRLPAGLGPAAVCSTSDAIEAGIGPIALSWAGHLKRRLGPSEPAPVARQSDCSGICRSGSRSAPASQLLNPFPFPLTHPLCPDCFGRHGEPVLAGAKRAAAVDGTAGVSAAGALPLRRSEITTTTRTYFPTLRVTPGPMPFFSMPQADVPSQRRSIPAPTLCGVLPTCRASGRRCAPATRPTEQRDFTLRRQFKNLDTPY